MSFIPSTEFFGAPLNSALKANASLASPPLWPCCSPHGVGGTEYGLNERSTHLRGGYSYLHV